MFKSYFFCRLLAAFGVLLTGAGVSLYSASESVGERERVSFNQGWRFQKGDPDGVGKSLGYDALKPWLLPTANAFRSAPAARPEDKSAPGEGIPFTRGNFNDSAWRLLDLPHDWGVESAFQQDLPSDSGKLPWWGVAWYRKTFHLPAADAAKRVFLDIDGAMSYATIWCNGALVGGWPYGYSSFRVDLTPHLKAGDTNTLAIRLDNPPDSSRWYPGGGIYRNVWLVKTNPVHVAQWGTRVTTPVVSKESATIVVETEIANDSPAPARVAVSTQLFRVVTDARGAETLQILATLRRSAPPVAVASGANALAREKFTLDNPALWHTTAPNRHVALTTVKDAATGKVLDSYKTPFGIRRAEFTADDGFHLNGARVPLNGVCMHHDLGALGSAINTRALERQLDLLLLMGANAIRTSHNPPAPELLALADKKGILIINEFSDMWERPKKRNGYSNIFKDWSEADLRAFVKRDRNHPSVIAWSIGNEVAEQGGGEHSLAVASRLSQIAREADPSRPTTSGNNSPAAATNGFQKTSDIYGYNYRPNAYNTFRKNNPSIPVYGSETASCVSSRGEYFFPVQNNKAAGRSDFHVSSYDLYAPPWAFPPDTEFAGLDKAPFAAGEFVWTGFDYLGEPTPYGSDTSNLLNFHSPEDKARAAAELEKIGKLRVPSRSSYFGIIDLAGFPKDRFYLYQARWRPDFPSAHILPHWNWSERLGETTPVHVYSSGDEAELFLNNTSLGRKKRTRSEYRFRWDDVKYAPGELRVVTWKNGKPWATATRQTTGDAAKLILEPDRPALRADGSDLLFVTVRVADAQNRTAPRAKNPVKLTLTGPGEIVATDNGDPTDHTPFSSRERKAFNGLALAIIRGKRNQTAPLTLRAESPGLAPAEIQIPLSPPSR